MAIKITENSVVNYENEPNVDRELFPNLNETGYLPEDYQQLIRDVDTLKSDVTTINGEITEIQGDITTAENNIEDLDDGIGALKNDLTNISEILEIPEVMTGSGNPYGSQDWVNVLENISLASGKTYLFTLTPENEYTGTVNVTISTSADGTPPATAIANATLGTGYSFRFSAQQDYTKVRVRLYGPQSNVNTAGTFKEADAENAIERIDSILDAPSVDGTYTLKVTVSDGNPTYTWVADA